MEQTSIDEGYFDLTANRKKPAVEIALTIQRAIGQKLKITVSEGIATNKLVSAIASKVRKPAAFNEVPPGGETEFLHPLPEQVAAGHRSEDECAIERGGTGSNLPRRRDAVGNAGTAAGKSGCGHSPDLLTALMSVP